MAFEFKIDGVVIPAPDEYKPSISDISSEESGRTDDGIMHNAIIATKTQYDMSWGDLSWEDCATLLNCIDGKTQFSFTHADPRVPGKFITKSFYVGDRNTPALVFEERFGRGLWRGMSMKFIEI